MIYGQRGGYGQHRRRRGIGRWLGRRGGRRPLLGLGITGAGAAALAVAVTIGVGQAGGSPACAAVLTANALTVPGAQAGGQAGGTMFGIATQYVLRGVPNCSYPSPPADQLFVALSPAEYDSAGGCGGYLEVTGSLGSVRVKVIDQCPECATGHIDLSGPAFAKLVPLFAGLVAVHYTYLRDPALPGPISIRVKDGSSQYWLALLADNTGNPLTSVAVQTSAGWQSLQRASDNYWTAPSGAGPGPFTVRLTDNQGNVATVSGITLSPGMTQVTGTSMYGAGGDPGPVPSAQAPVPAAASSAPALSAPATSALASALASTAPAAASGSSPASPPAPASPSASRATRPSATRASLRTTTRTPRGQTATSGPPTASQAVPVPVPSAPC